MTFSWFDIVVLFGVIQGIVSAILLVKNREKAIGSKLLAALLFVFSLLSFKIALHTLGLWDTKTFRYFPLAIDLLIQPLLYFYVCALIIPDFRISGKKILHFFPPLIFFVYAILVYLAVIQKTDLHVKDLIAERWHFNAIKAFEDDLSVFSTIVYGWLSFRLVQGYRKWLNNHISGTNHQTFGWLKNVLSFTAILGLGLLINICLDQVFYFSNHHFLHWQVFYIYLSFLIYYIAYRSYQKEAFIIPKQQRDLTIKGPVNSSKYSINDRASAKLAILTALEKDKLFLNSELTLALLASFINLSPALVSETINKELGKPFRMLINDFRVNEVKHKLLDRNYTHLSISGIAIECGFNSEASFYRIFKAATGFSPKTYLNQAKRASLYN